MKKRSLFLVTVLMVVLVSVLSVPAHAGPPENASGVWHYRPLGLPEVKVAGGNTILTIKEEAYWEGTFDGVSEDHGTVVFYAAGHWIFQGWVEFDPVTVDGRTGSLTMRVIGSKPDAGADWAGTWVIIKGTGDLKGLQGQGTWWGPGWQGDPLVYGVIPYAGNVHFEPD